MSWILIALIVLFIIIMAMVEQDDPGLGWPITLTVLAAGGYCILQGKQFYTHDLWVSMYNSWPYILVGILLYVIIGTLWSFYKWYKFVRYRLSINQKVQQPNEHKEQILTWMIYWPPSLLWYLINKPITRLYKAIYKRVYNVYVKISNNALKP